MEEVEGKNEEGISLWEAPTACVPGAGKSHTRSGKKVGSASCKPRSHTAPARSRGKTRKSSARRTGKGFNFDVQR